MEPEKKKYIVKGRIKKLNNSTYHERLRYGSPHFLPLEEVCLCNRKDSFTDGVCENRIWVRGNHRSGMLRTKRTHIRFLENLRIEEVSSPSEETLAFIQNNKLLFFEEMSWEHIQVLKLFQHIEKKNYPKIEESVIEDEQFLKAQAFVRQLQSSIAKKEYNEIIANQIKFPLINIRWEKGRKLRDMINENFFRNSIDRIFTKETEERIKQTDIDTIYPSERSMIIGSLTIEISKNNEFRINKVVTL